MAKETKLIEQQESAQCLQRLFDIELKVMMGQLFYFKMSYMDLVVCLDAYTKFMEFVVDAIDDIKT